VSVPVEESWQRIVIWLGRHAPVTAAAIRPAAPAAEIRRVADAVGLAMPDELLAVVPAFGEFVAGLRLVSHWVPGRCGPCTPGCCERCARPSRQDGNPREEGLAAIEKAITIGRRPAAANPAAYQPDLASSLNNLSNRLTDLD
jgi:hypothetical protein